MKRIALLVVLGLLVGAVAYGEVVTNESIPITLSVFVPCADGGNGEIVALSGPLHVLTRVTITPNTLSLGDHFQPQGISGQGLTTGDKYQATGETQSSLNVQPVPGFPFNTTFTNNFKIIGQGPGNNFLVHETFHLTVNAKGDVTTFVDNFKVECK